MARSLRLKVVRETVAIVGDGQTERIYFSDVRDTDRPAGLSIFPDYPRKIGSFKGVIDRAITLAQEYNKVYALIDMDKIIQEQQQKAYHHAKLIALSKGVIVLENNPCFEIWLLLHFVQVGRLFNNCNEVSVELKHASRIPGYDKSERSQKNARLYCRYKNQLVSNAMINAKLLEENRLDHDLQYPRAETFRFFEWYLAKLK